jgi:hypothetical protein
MTRSIRRRSGLFAALAFTASASAIVAFATPAFAADDVAVCVKASELAQSFRADGKYRLSREQLIVCSREACPGVVRKDCAQWLGEVEGSMPTIVISAKDATGDLAAVKVTVDGTLLTEKLDGKPVLMDPGEHIFKFEVPNAPPKEDRVVIRAGEKNRNIEVTFDAAPAIGGGAVTPPAPNASEPPATSSSSGVPAAAYVFGGIGVASFAVGAVLGITGKSDVNNLRSTCAPNCTDSQVTSDKTKLALADTLMGVGIVSVGVAAYFFFTRHSSEPTPAAALPASARYIPTFDVKSVPGGGMATLGGSF